MSSGKRYVCWTPRCLAFRRLHLHVQRKEVLSAVLFWNGNIPDLCRRRWKNYFSTWGDKAHLKYLFLDKLKLFWHYRNPMMMVLTVHLFMEIQGMEPLSWFFIQVCVKLKERELQTVPSQMTCCCFSQFVL